MYADFGSKHYCKSVSKFDCYGTGLSKGFDNRNDRRNPTFYYPVDMLTSNSEFERWEEKILSIA